VGLFFEIGWKGFLLQVRNQICAMPLEHDHKRMMSNNALAFLAHLIQKFSGPKVVIATGLLDERFWL